jgi:hypothetical protein
MRRTSYDDVVQIAFGQGSRATGRPLTRRDELAAQPLERYALLRREAGWILPSIAPDEREAFNL